MKTHKLLVLKMSAIILDKEIQPRSNINDVVVKKYAEAMRRGDQFPPITIYYDGEKHWLADGFHRLRAKQANNEKTILAEVRPGSRRDAKLFAVEVNVNNGLQRTNVDKRRAVERLLRDHQWSQWSNREIANRCGVNEKTVRNIKKRLPLDSSQRQSLTNTLQSTSRQSTQKNRMLLSNKITKSRIKTAVAKPYDRITGIIA